jgi:hypothetical protein
VTCGHHCCRIAANAYHVHAAAPERCEHCHDARTEVDNLSAIVNAVVDRVAPEIPGLPRDPDQLVDRVIAVTADIHQRSLAEPDLAHLSLNRRRTVLAARVGIALAFPDRVAVPR